MLCVVWRVMCVAMFGYRRWLLSGICSHRVLFIVWCCALLVFGCLWLLFVVVGSGCGLWCGSCYGLLLLVGVYCLLWVVVCCLLFVDCLVLYV